MAQVLVSSPFTPSGGRCAFSIASHDSYGIRSLCRVGPGVDRLSSRESGAPSSTACSVGRPGS
eukprot:14224595-Heterocapsa_arctica.AAC.1